MRLKARRVTVVMIALVGVVVWLLMNPLSYEAIFTKVENTGAEAGLEVKDSDEEADGVEGEMVSGEGNATGEVIAPLATEVLERLAVKGRAPKTGYAREEFYSGWPTVEGCSLRQRIIRREFGESAVIMDGCNVVAGEYDEPYTGNHIVYEQREEIAKGVQIDHVVALSDAWQKGAQELGSSRRYELATDPLNLLAVDASANKKKSDGDAATWLPPNKKFRCQYVARQVAVKYKYTLWVTVAEKDAILKVLENCPNERVIGV